MSKKPCWCAACISDGPPSASCPNEADRQSYRAERNTLAAVMSGRVVDDLRAQLAKAEAESESRRKAIYKAAMEHAETDSWVGCIGMVVQLRARAEKAEAECAKLRGELETHKQLSAYCDKEHDCCAANNETPCGTCDNCERAAQCDRAEKLSAEYDAALLAVEEMREALASILDLDANEMLHRDPLDTDPEFIEARDILAKHPPHPRAKVVAAALRMADAVLAAYRDDEGEDLNIAEAAKRATEDYAQALAEKEKSK